MMGIHRKKWLALPCLAVTLLSGSAFGGEPGNSDCFPNPDSKAQFPSQKLASGADVFHHYAQPDSHYPIYGYANHNPAHVKTIKVVNNYSHTIYPVLSAQNSFKGSDGKTKTLSRIFVGKPACNDPQNSKGFFAGIPAGGSATIYVPKQMWNAGHVAIFTEIPPFLQTSATIKSIYTVDTAANSPNRGYLLYTSDTAESFRAELPFQLVEYTMMSTCADDTSACATAASDKKSVDFEFSATDQLFLPVAVEVSSGSRGYIGTGMTVEAFQKSLRDFVKGRSGLDYDKEVGWPFYYGSNKEKGYSNGLIKMPMGYITLYSLLFASDQISKQPAISDIWVYNKTGTSAVPVSDPATLMKVRSNLEKRWTNFWNNPEVCKNRRGQDFCQKFLKTMTFLRDNIVTACQYGLANNMKRDASLCLAPRGTSNLYSVETDIDKIQKLIGYSFSGLTFDNPGGKYVASDPGKMCTARVRPTQANMGQFYSDCFRDAAKSVQRGVPYPFWEYSNEFYPDLSSIYTLNPAVWLVHKKLGLSVYAFSIDDTVGNQEGEGNGITIAVGGLNGLVNKNPFVEKSQ